MSELPEFKKGGELASPGLHFQFMQAAVQVRMHSSSRLFDLSARCDGHR